jgi:hypothetical protein
MLNFLTELNQPVFHPIPSSLLLPRKLPADR